VTTNIENHTHRAKLCLTTSQAKIEAREYDTALAMLAEAYSHTRELLEQVYKLQALKVEVTRPAGEDSGGSEQ
jgi:hypothetical protein